MQNNTDPLPTSGIPFILFITAGYNIQIPQNIDATQIQKPYKHNSNAGPKHQSYVFELRQLGGAINWLPHGGKKGAPGDPLCHFLMYFCCIFLVCQDCFQL